MTKDRTIPMIVMVVALVGLVINFTGGATGASAKGTIIDYPTPTYYGGQHSDFPEVSEWAYYQYGIRTAEGQLGLDLAPKAADWVVANADNEYTGMCSVGCQQYCPGTLIKIGLRYETTECMPACKSRCEDLIEERFTFLQD